MAGENRGLRWINAPHKAGFSLHRVIVYSRILYMFSSRRYDVLPTFYYICINYKRNTTRHGIYYYIRYSRLVMVRRGLALKVNLNLVTKNCTHIVPKIVFEYNYYVMRDCVV